MNDTLIKLCGLYENTSERTGRRYFVGYLGGAKLLLLEDTKAEPGKPGWNLCIAQRPEKRTDTTNSPREPVRRQQPRPAAQAQRGPATRKPEWPPPAEADGLDWDRGDPIDHIGAGYEPVP